MNIIEKLGITKGPWRRTESIGDYAVRNIEGDNIAVAANVYPECVIALDEADALLIAAAPEMLEALIESIMKAEVLNDMINEFDSEMLEAIRKKDKRIIAIERATGKTWPEIKELL